MGKLLFKLLLMLITAILYLRVCLISLAYAFGGYLVHAGIIVLTLGSYLTAYSKFKAGSPNISILFIVIGSIFLLVDVTVVPNCRKIEGTLRAYLELFTVKPPSYVWEFVKFKLNESKYQQRDFAAKQQAEPPRQEQQNTNTNQSSQTDQTDQQNKSQSYSGSSDTKEINDMFVGVTTPEEAKSRYRQLLKIYHPDNQNGDTEMSETVQRQYESKLKELNAS